MRVLHVIPSVSERSGGPAAAIVPLCRELQKQGIEPESNAFGLWDRRNAGGLPYQRKMRGEW